ncbi:MAG: AAA family ATPase, partial [Gammaproteobacteria bacterium]|nr:AAA family ATPase [Gammaproteobacteria bacterium]
MGKPLPFSNQPDARSYFPYPFHERAYKQLRRSIGERRGLIVLTAAEGTGKTVLLRRFIQASESDKTLDIHPIAEPWRGSAAVLRAMGQILDSDLTRLKPRDQWNRVIQRLTELHASRVDVVLLIDNATFVDFEVLKLLVDLIWSTGTETGLQVVLSGANELVPRLRLNMSEVWDRATHVHLKRFNHTGTNQYIDHQLHVAGIESEQLFSKNTVNRIHSYSGGIPVKINNLCNIALSLSNVSQIKTHQDPPSTTAYHSGSQQRYTDASSHVTHAYADKRSFLTRL